MSVGHAALLSMRAIASARRLMPSSIFRVMRNAAGSMTSIVSRERMPPGIHTRLREISRVPSDGRSAPARAPSSIPHPVAVSAQHQRTERLDRLDRKSSAAADGNFVADRKLLPLGQNAFGARRVEVSEQAIEPVIAVETAAPVAHLHQPRPDGRRRGVDRDAECRFIARQRHLCIAEHGACELVIGRSPRSAPSTQSIHACSERTVRTLRLCAKCSKNARTARRRCRRHAKDPAGAAENQRPLAARNNTRIAPDSRLARRVL